MAASVGRILSRATSRPSSPAAPSFSLGTRASVARCSPRESPPLPEVVEEEVPTSGISCPLSEILRELSKRIPESFVKVRVEDGFEAKYIPWHIVNRIMNLHAPEWSGEVRNITYSADGKSVSVVYHVTLYGTDAEVLIDALVLDT